LNQFERVCPLADIDELIAETAPPKRLAAALKRAGVHVRTAKA
jgi:DeoR/GlpR family transcriptional regulator of sugar metabolism